MGLVPYLSADEMREVDRAMIEDYHIELVQMMENAGRSLAELARERFLQGDPRDKMALVLCGRGNNGGGGLAAARHLHNWGARIEVFTTYPVDQFRGIPAHQLDILRRMQVSISAGSSPTHLPPADLIIDALIGYSLSGVPHGAAAKLIKAANQHSAPVLSLDIPSGVDSSTGEIHTPSIRADATLTLALPKQGLKAAAETGVLGELYLADISVPPELYASKALNLDVGPVFALKSVIRLL